MICKNCGKEFKTWEFIDGKMRNLQSRKFCIECSEFGNHNTKPSLKNNYGNCKNCGKELTNSKKVFCNSDCFHEFKYKEFIKKWKNGEESGISGKCGISKTIRKYMLEKYNYKCVKCGWGEENPFTGNIPLEIHHIDGNYQNNKEENLIVLCPNCHSLTDTYKNSNNGNGRKSRRK